MIDWYEHQPILEQEMTVFLTIFIGVSVYVIGQIILRFVVEPMTAQRDTISKVADFLIFHANRYTNPGAPKTDERKDELDETRVLARTLASQLIVRTQAVPGYERLSKTAFMRSLGEVRSASKGLLFLSNNLYDAGEAIKNYKVANDVANALGISTEFTPETPEAAEAAD